MLDRMLPSVPELPRLNLVFGALLFSEHQHYHALRDKTSRKQRKYFIKRNTPGADEWLPPDGFKFGPLPVLLFPNNESSDFSPLIRSSRSSNFHESSALPRVGEEPKGKARAKRGGSRSIEPKAFDLPSVAPIEARSSVRSLACIINYTVACNYATQITDSSIDRHQRSAARPPSLRVRRFFGFHAQ